MPEIEVSQGSTEQLVSRGESGNYKITDVSNSRVSFAHGDRRLAQNGAEIQPGDRVKLLGVEGPLWAYAHDNNATLTIEPAKAVSFGIEYMSRPDFGEIDRVDTVGEIDLPVDVDGTTDFRNFLSSALSREITDWSAGTLPVSVGSNESNVYSDSLTGDGSFNAQVVPDGREVAYRADPDNAGRAFVENFPLDPGEHIELSVDDVSVPAVTFNDQNDTMYAIVEVA